MTEEMVTWLRQELDEEERVARAAMHRPRSHPPTIGHWGYVHEDLVDGDGLVLAPRVWIPAAEHIARHDPARVLRDVAAKRAIVELHSDPNPNASGYPHPCQTLRLLALPYADREGYRSEWAPDEEANRG